MSFVPTKIPVGFDPAVSVEFVTWLVCSPKLVANVVGADVGYASSVTFVFPLLFRL